MAEKTTSIKFGDDNKENLQTMEPNEQFGDSVVNEFGDFDGKINKSKKVKLNDSKAVSVPLKRKKKVEVLVVRPIPGKRKVDEIVSKVPPIKVAVKVLDENKIVLNKPPLPPAAVNSAPRKMVQKPKSVLSHFMRKAEEENDVHLNKLAANNEQLRLEVANLKAQLQNERNGVRGLRAQYDGDYRKVKNECKKLLDIINNQKRPTAPSSITNSPKKTNDASADVLRNEIAALKENIKVLEEKYQISSDAEKRKTADIREMKALSEAKQAQISKTAKTEIHKLLEELKSKDRNLSILKKEIHTLKELQHRPALLTSSGALVSCQMRKTKEIEEQQEDAVTAKINMEQSTCGANPLELMNHERIMEAHESTRSLSFSSKDDNDSALSSAPQSLSPQPRDIWEIESKPSAHDLKEFDFLQKKYDDLSRELMESRDQICNLERVLMKNNRDTEKAEKYSKKIKMLESREQKLEKETHELREQNELLEFRILELEESHDKWSLRSNSTPDTKDGWTDTEKESDDVDSGFTSPHRYHHQDAQSSSPVSQNLESVSPCSLSILDQVPTEDVRKHILLMSKRAQDEDDKVCLLQILSLLNNLEALSQDQYITGEDLQSLDIHVDKFHKQDSLDIHRSFGNTPLRSQQSKIIATVQPYSSTSTSSFHTDSQNLSSSPKKPTLEASPNKSCCWTTTSLGESGVFEEDFSLSDVFNQATQTESESHPPKTNAELCAEIEKLNRFRKKIEESTKVRCQTSKQEFLNLLNKEQRHMKFYQERTQMLENKVAVYESSGDLQIKLLADRLQREIQLESKVKLLSEKVEKLEHEHLDLEESNCELEEIENDSRLRLQRLEIEYEMIVQRNSEMEVSRDSYHEKYQDAKDNISYLEDCLHKCEERIFLLEEHETDLRHKLELTQSFLPAIVLYQTYRCQKAHFKELKSVKYQMQVKTVMSRPQLQLIAPIPQIKQIKSVVCQTSEVPSEIDCNHPVQVRLNELIAREQELTQSITELNRAYNETLENADNLWAQMEKEYKDKIVQSEEMETNLRAKIVQLEKRLMKDTEYAQERIAVLEETELQLKHRVCKINRDTKDQQQKHLELLLEMNNLKEEHEKLQAFVNGPVVDNLEKEKRKTRHLEEELVSSKKFLDDVEEMHGTELGVLKTQVIRINKELNNSEVTNGELKEEVETLEARINELEGLRITDLEKIKHMADELESKHRQLHRVQQFVTPSPSKSLAQELNHRPKPIIRQRTVIPATSDLNRANFMLAEAIRNSERSPLSSNTELNVVAKEVKSLADSIISNAEARSRLAPTKRSFVEEAKSRFAKWV